MRLCREWNGQEYMGRTLTMNIAEEKPGHAGGSPKWKEGPSEKPVRQPRQAAPHRLPIPRPPAPLRRAVASAVAPSCNCPDPCWCFVPIRRAAARASWATSPGRWRRRTSPRSSASAARSSRCASRPTARPATSRASVRAANTPLCVGITWSARGSRFARFAQLRSRLARGARD